MSQSLLLGIIGGAFANIVAAAAISMAKSKSFQDVIRQHWWNGLLTIAVFALGARTIAETPKQPLEGDARSSIADANSILEHAIVAFDLESCPAGWEIDPKTQGRYLVGLHIGETPGNITGVALSSGEDRATGQHSHAFRYVVIAHNGASRDGLRTEFLGNSNVKINVRADAQTDNAGEKAGTNAPYVSYLFCRRRQN